MSFPRATLRLQLHRDFGFADAASLVPYIASLGISHLYLSPILTARSGSMHGYDVTDPTQVNPELGGEAGLRDLVGSLRRSDLGLIVDIVPNHMAAGGLENPWWADVLRYGQASRYASFFDIDWNSSDPDLRGKVLAPFLGEPYGDTLNSGAIRLAHDDGGEFVVCYYDNRFPVRPDDNAEIQTLSLDAYDPETEAGRERLHRLLDRQHYRLAWWRVAGDEINWRRFFNINGLAALRIEDEAVFEATHAKLFQLYEEGLIDGVRVDHVDGLADPPSYCRRLRARLDQLAAKRPPDVPGGQAWLVVEKILGAGERLATDWQIDGTSGYDFMEQVGALLHDRAGEPILRRLWESISGRTADFAREEIAARHEVLHRSFAAQLDAVTNSLHRIARNRTDTRDTTSAAIQRAVEALLAHFPVYRTYGCGERSPGDAAAFATAMQGALHDLRASDRYALELVDRWLASDPTDPIHCKAAIQFQQLSAPLAAKAVEDTAFYRYGVLLSRNEVGADVSRFSISADEFHADCLARHKNFPYAMLATATHDHKRGEDVRVRIAALSEFAEEWGRAVRHWFVLNEPHRRRDGQPMPTPGDEAMLYQMIVGAWPVQLAPDDTEGVRAFTDRLAEWQLKAQREAKLATDWDLPNLEYEDAARSFLYTIMIDAPGFAKEAAEFAHRIGPAGAVNGLVQTLLEMTVPGVPDFYQGTEFWDQSLVDPDNRRPVDFAARMNALSEGRSPPVLAESWRNGHVKQAMIQRVLAFRRRHPTLFACGEYRPLQITGTLAHRALAFLRKEADAACVVVVPLHSAGLLHGDSILIPPEAWQDTAVRLPEQLAVHSLRNVIAESEVRSAGSELPLRELLARFPVALLASGE